MAEAQGAPSAPPQLSNEQEAAVDAANAANEQTPNISLNHSNEPTLNEPKSNAPHKHRPPRVNEYEYWLKGDPEVQDSSHAKGAFLSYDFYLGLAILGGYFGLDHLYARSPLTFLAKLVINMLFFGVWWLYDGVNALWSKDIIKVFGMGVPGLGPKGIAAGVFAQDTPDPNHLTFLIYAAGLFFGGIFGADSFIVGDSSSGLIRLLLCISIIGTPLALFWWFYKMFRFFTNTKSVIYEYSDYFGAPSGGFSMFGAFLGNGPADIIPATARAIVSPFNKLFDLFNNLITTIKTALGFGTKIVTAVTSLGGLISPMPNPGEIGMAAQRGGNPDDTSLNVLPFSLLGTLALIVLSGFALTYRRTKNGTIEQDDTPPEPGVFRKTNTKKSNPTA